MVPYLIVFLIVFFCTYRAEKLYKKNYKIRGTIYILISILFMSVLAAVRNDEVGIDILSYVIPPFKWALQYNFIEFMKIGNLEYGYMMLTFIIANVFKDYHWILFYVQFFISTFIYIFAFKEKDKMPMWLVMIVFLLLMYNDTLTMMRQSIAVMLILLSYVSISEKKYVKTFVLYALAILFHNTAMIALLGYMFFVINYTNKIKKENKKIINITVLLIFMICLLFYKKILYFLTFSIGILPSKFYDYFGTKFYLNNINISKSILLFKITWILIACVYNKIIREEQMPKLILFFLIIDFSIYLISFKLGPIMRLGYYFSYPALLYLIPQCSRMFKKNKYNRIICYILIVLFLFGFWYFNIIVHNESGNTYPYKSDIIMKVLKK